MDPESNGVLERDENCFPEMSSRLWKPVAIGHDTLQHRGAQVNLVAMAPLTRYRSPGHIPDTPLMTEYYTQRANGGLIVSEACFIAKEAGGYPNAPGIWSKEQVEAWKPITLSVRQQQSVFYCQLWAIGRANKGDEPDVPIVAPSAIGFQGGKVPRAMTVEDIQRFIGHYAHAAKNSIEAGFNGVELHGAHGYLIDQFLRASSNLRTDEYGGSLERRARFLFEAVGAVVDAIGQERTAIRLSPFLPFQVDEPEKDPFETWGYVCKELKQRFPRLAYVSITDPRLDVAPEQQYSSDTFRAIFRGIDQSMNLMQKDNHFVFPEPCPEHPTLFLSAGGYRANDAEVVGERTGDLVGYGRHYISNPDLPFRLKHSIPLTRYDRSTFYTPGAKGYTDYPFASGNPRL